MGQFLWHMWAQYVSIFACVYTAWASVWGILFPKFFWDFVDGTLTGKPAEFTGLKCTVDITCGIIPSAAAQPFVSAIVKMPVIQILALIMSLGLLALEYLPVMEKLSIYRSFVFKAVVLTVQSFFAVLFYQGVNGAIYSAIAASGYFIAQFRGEYMMEAKDNRGREGGA
jgi:hypothetical protein